MTVSIRRAALAALAGVLCILGFAVPPAHADELLPVSVNVSSVSRRTLTPDASGDITISGTITNNSADPMTWVAVEMWTSSEVLLTPSAVANALEQAPVQPPGRPLRNDKTGNRMFLTTENQFAPGQTLPFTVRATAAELRLTREGVYRVGVHARALTSSGVVRTVGVNRWLMPLTASPHPHTEVVVLAAPATMASPGKFTDDSLLGEITGRLGRLLTAAERPGAMFAIDPALLDEVAALGEPHTVEGAQQPPSDEAQRFAQRLKRLVATGHGYRLPYGSVDLARASSSGMLPVTARRLASAVDTAEPVGALPTAVLGGATLDAAIVGAINPDVTFATNVTRSAGRVVRTAPAMSSPEPVQSDVWHQTQTALAQELVASLAGQPLVRLIESPSDLAAASISEPWRGLTPLTKPEGDDPGWLAPAPGITDPARDARTAAYSRDLDAFSDLSGDTAVHPATLALLRSQSALVSSGQALALLTAAPKLSPAAVQLRVQRSFIMTGRENSFPISVVNNSGLPVQVYIDFTSSSPQRVTVAKSETITVPAGETVGLAAAVTASSNSVVTVDATLKSASGRPVGTPVEIEITSTQAGVIAWVIIVASGLLLFGGTAWRIRAVRRAAAQRAGS